MPLSRYSVRTDLENELTHNLSGNIQPQLSQFAELPWIDLGIKSGVSVPELISTSKKKRKKAQAGNILSNIRQKNLQARKKPQPSPP